MALLLAAGGSLMIAAISQRDDLDHQCFGAVIVIPDELTPTTPPTPNNPWLQFPILMRSRYELKATERGNLVYPPKTR